MNARHGVFYLVIVLSVIPSVATTAIWLRSGTGAAGVLMICHRRVVPFFSRMHLKAVLLRGATTLLLAAYAFGCFSRFFRVIPGVVIMATAALFAMVYEETFREIVAARDQHGLREPRRSRTLYQPTAVSSSS